MIEENVSSERKILLLSHYASYAMQDLLFEYFIKHKAILVTKINFPLLYLPFLKQIEITISEKGKTISFKKVASLLKPKPIAYFLQIIQLIYVVIASRYRYDVLIAQDSLLAMGGIFIRAVGKCKKVILYSHGTGKTRFDNKIFQIIYETVDKFIARQSDYNFVLSQEMVEVRKKQGIACDKVFWIPASIPLDSLSRKKAVNNKKIIFIGVLDARNGVCILPDVVASVKKKFPKVNLDIIGDGVFLDLLKTRTKTLGLRKNIHFLGRLNFKDYAANLTNYSIGIAPYEFSENNFTQITDPMKVRLYMSAGLPIVVTKNFTFSEEIRKNNLGFAVDYDAKSFSDKLIRLLSDNEFSNKMRARTLEYSKKYDLHVFYNKVFEKIL